MNKRTIKLIVLFLELALIVLLVIVNLRIGSVVKDEIIYAKTTGSTIQDTQNIPRLGFANLIVSKFLKPSPAPTSTPEPEKKVKDTYLFAAIGDSMVDTMGGGLDYLATEMRKKYPDKTMVFYNYGIGSENLEGALGRFDKPYDNLGRTQETLAQLSPDVLIVGSYSYNPPFPYDEAKQTDSLLKLLDKAKSVSNDVYLLVEIAPLQYGFGDGAGGVNWVPSKANEHSANIVSLLNNSIGTGTNSGVKIINVYEKSLVEGSIFGQKVYISPHDNIHPSVEGQILTATTASELITLP